MDTPIIPQQLPQNEHDLLVTIHGQVGRALSDIKDVKDDIKELKDNVAERVSILESTKMSKNDLDQAKTDADAIHKDHENRIRNVEKQADETTTQLSTFGKTWIVIAAILTITLTALEIYLKTH